MSLFSVPRRLVLLAALALLASGCFPMGEGPADEEKDPYYLNGKARYNSMDYDGAILAFERALIANPKSAAAHLQLAFLYEEKKLNNWAAIYHFERHLQLRPDSHMTETVKQHILACKMQLARTVPFAMVNRHVQEELRKLYATNSYLLQVIEQLKAQRLEDAVAFSNKLALAREMSMLPSAQMPAQPRAQPSIQRRPSFTERQAPPMPIKTVPRSAITTPRIHIVRPGETMSTIARRYDVRLSALQSANPRVDARRLKAGQILNVPGARN